MAIIILWTALFLWWFFAFCEVWSLLASLMLWIYWFLQFVIWIFYPIDERWSYEIVLLWMLVCIWGIVTYFYPAEWIFSAGFVVLCLLFIGIYIVQHWEMPAKQTTIISVRRILAWERIFKKLNIPRRKISLYEWLEKSPKWFERLFEIANLGLLFSLLLFFFWWIFSSAKVELNLWYWFWIVMFLVNTFLLKRVGYATDVSRFALALIVSFVLYSILLISWSSIESILPLLIVWWFLCQIALFFVDRINISLFWDKDYVYWTVVTFIAFICNIVLLCRVNLPVQFLFSLIFVYVGVELMMMYYIIKFLNERKDAIENAELEEKKVLQELVGNDNESED